MKQKRTLQEIVETIIPDVDRINRYVEYVPRFIDEASQGLQWDKDNEVFRQFLFENDHCAGTIGQGDFERIEFENLERSWGEISNLLAQIAQNQEEPNYPLYKELSQLIRTCTRNDKMAATRRMICSLQPGLLLPLYSNNSFDRLYRFIRRNVTGGDVLSNNNDWFYKSHELMKFFEKEITIELLDYTGLNDNDIPLETLKKIMLRTLPWQILEQIKIPKPILEDASEENFMIRELVNILTEHKPQIILQGPPGTGKTYTAKDVAEQLICGKVSDDKNIQQKNLETSGQFELIQFHPSYSYEDFVQGIAVKIVDKQAQYNVEARVLMEFAHIANQNNIDSNKPQEELDQEAQCNEAFSRFVEKLIDTIDMTGAGIPLTNSVCSIARIASEWFVIEGSNDRFDSYIRFDDIKMSYLAGNITRKDIVNNLDLSKTARAYASYVERILTMFRESEFVNYQTGVVNKVERKNYVLIIDEINRANLATVLGELIYALEYRGKPVKTLYSRSDDESQNQIILPPNLYIIGTMNTADRSVNSMDYAIRRRFSFINMLPKYIESEDENFDEKLFECVSNLFVGNLEDYDAKQNIELVRSIHLSEEFRPEDVWIGHSYFIGDEKSVQYRIKHEIIPLIEEYIQDGILKESARAVISALKTGQY